LVMEEFVALGKKYHVTPVVIFQPTACRYGAGYAEFAAEVDRLRRKYPTLIIPVDLVETWPANYFSVPAHVQRTVAIETSRRMGRIMRDVLAGRTRSSFASRIIQLDSTATIHVVGATMSEACGYDPLFSRGYFADVTSLFSELCEGRSSCRYQKGSDPREPPPPDKCKPIYSVTYKCSGGPVRAVREEGTEILDGYFAIDCREEAGFNDDPMPYGIQVVFATYGANQGGLLGNATMTMEAVCDGRFQCDFPIRPSQLGARPRATQRPSTCCTAAAASWLHGGR
jgi:hypothetical protein